MSSASEGTAQGQSDLESALAASGDVAVFEDEERSPLRRLHHFLHAYPTVVPFIVLLIGVGVFTALVAGFFPLGEVAKLVNIGVLSAFIVICSSVILLRVRKPDLPRAFKTPWVPLVPII